MMAAFASHRAASSGSCWSNLCCSGYDIDPTHWKERVREAERERAREPLSGGVSGGHVDRMVSRRLRQRSPWRRRFTSLTGSVLFKGLIFQIRHTCPSISLSALPAGSSFSNSATPVRRNFVNSIFGNFPIIFLQFVHTLQIFLKLDHEDLPTFMTKLLCGLYMSLKQTVVHVGYEPESKKQLTTWI